MRRAILEAFAEARVAFRLALAGSTIAEAADDPKVWEVLSAALAKLYAVDGPLFAAMIAAGLRTAGLVGFNWADDEIGFVGRATAFLDREGARLVTAVTAETREAVRRVLSIAKNLDALRRELVAIPALGLDQVQARAFAKRVSELIAAGDSAGWSEKRLRQAIDREFRRRLRYRANRIAITEARTAANAAQEYAVDAAVDRGELPAGLELEWITRVVRACPICKALDGQRRPVRNGLFTSRVIEAGRYKGQRLTIQRPTVHPYCYCGIRLVPPADVEDKGQSWRLVASPWRSTAGARRTTRARSRGTGTARSTLRRNCRPPRHLRAPIARRHLPA